jgi:hypothetical protein
MIGSAKVFLKSQVWFWKDPIYGKKETGKTILEGEALIRYSRYVVLMEDDRDCGSMLVVPCSTINNSDEGVKINLNSSGRFNSCYAKVTKIFPASKKSLERYICTLGSNEFSKIQLALLKLLSLDLCDLSQIDPNDDKVEEVKVENNLKVVSPPLVEIQQSEPIVQVEKKDEVVKKPYSKANKLWTEKRKADFMEVYENEGPKAAAEKFNLVKTAAYAQFSKIMKENREKRNKEEVVKENEKESSQAESTSIEEIGSDGSELLDKLSIVEDGCFIKAINKVTWMILNHLKEGNLISEIYDLRRDNKIHLYEESWYKSLFKVIYRSFISFLEISVKNKNDYNTPTYEIIAHHPETWKFLERIYNCKFSVENPTLLMDKYHESYGSSSGIEKLFLNVLEFNLKFGYGAKFSSPNLLNINKEGVDVIINKIRDMYCGKE